MKKFGYCSDKTLLHYNIDVSSLFTGTMESDLLKAIRDSVQTRFMTFQHNTCRETEDVITIPFVYCSGSSLASKINWLEDFYTKHIVKVVSDALGRSIKPINNIGRAITVQVIGHGMRTECHVDVYPTAANLYLKMAPHGGELVISPELNTRGYQNILSEASKPIAMEKMTLGIVHLKDNPHTVSYCWDGVNEEIPLRGLPDIKDDIFWENSRIAINFNFDDPLMENCMPSVEERSNIYHHING